MILYEFAYRETEMYLDSFLQLWLEQSPTMIAKLKGEEEERRKETRKDDVNFPFRVEHSLILCMLITIYLKSFCCQLRAALIYVYKDKYPGVIWTLGLFSNNDRFPPLQCGLLALMAAERNVFLTDTAPEKVPIFQQMALPAQILALRRTEGVTCRRNT